MTQAPSIKNQASFQPVSVDKRANFYLLFVDRMTLLVLGAVVIFNGVTNYIFGEIIAEGYALGVSLLYLTFRVKLKTSYVFQVLSLFAFIIISLINISMAENPIRLIFLYPYVFFILLLFLPIYRENSGLNANFLASVLILFACVSSGHAVLQRLGFPIVLQLETELRATGLSRSSLNLTGCLFSALAIVVLTMKESIKKYLSIGLIFCGLIAAGGRGGIICAVTLIILFYFISFINNRFSALALVIVLLAIALSAGENSLRAFTAFDFTNDESNLQRLDSYYEFFLLFKFFGEGVGSTSPAALRFVDALGFESLILNTIYELGVGFTLIFATGIVFWLVKMPRRCRSKVYILSISIFPMFVGQQLYGSPSAFCCLILCLYCVLAHDKDGMISVQR